MGRFDSNRDVLSFFSGAMALGQCERSVRK